MATLPSDRTKLALAQSNQNPLNVLGSSQNKNALTEAYDTIDALYNYAVGLISAGTLSKLGVINVKDYNASGLATTAVGSITTGTKVLTLTTTPDFVAGQGINLQGAIEASSLQVTAAATVSSNVTVTLNGVAFPVAVVNGDTAIQVATKIRAATYAGWTAGGTAGTDTVTFTSTTSGTKTDATYSAGTTTATGTMTTTTQGTADQISTVSSVSGLAVNIADNATRTITTGTILHDDTAAFVAANSSLSTTGGKIIIPNGTYKLTSKFTTSSNVHLLLSPGAIIKRGVNGYILNLGIKSTLKGGTMDADGANFTGDLLQINTGTNVAGSEGLQVIEDVNLNNFDTYAINYDTVNTGFLSKINRCNFVPYNNTAVAIKWPNETTTGGNRSIQHCYSGCPLVDLNGCDNGIITGNTVGVQAGDTRASLVFSASPKKVIITGNRFAHGTNLLTFFGSDHTISCNEVASAVAFNSTCVNVHYDAINTDSGFSGTVPYAKNYISTKGQEIAYTTAWTATGTAPSFGNADVRARYIVEGRTCKVRIAIVFGSTSTYGTNTWNFTLPLATTSTAWHTGSAFLGDRSGSVFSRVDTGTITLYTGAGTVASSTVPITWASGNILTFEIEYNLS